jgi:hypothetical protein
MPAETILVKDFNGNPQEVATSQQIITRIGDKEDAPLNSTPDTTEASVVSILKGTLKNLQQLPKSTTEYSVAAFTVAHDDVTKPTIGNVKGVLFEFSSDFEGTINGLATTGLETATRYFEAPYGGQLVGMTYTITAGSMNVFKMALD